MKILIQDLTKSFESKTKNKNERYNEFIYYCYCTFDKKISSKGSDKIKNKYISMRDNTLKYLIANKKDIITELSK
tara:strand:- start:343 stop:567 length:225 start_codon:yes stop_codon:yes gene_type:complete